MVVCPASRRRLVHNHTLKFPRTHRSVSHSIRKCLSLLSHPREREVVLAIALERKRSFLKSVRQTLHLLRFGSQAHHVATKTGHGDAPARPVDVRFAIFVDKHTRVYAHDSFNRLCHRGKRTGRVLACCHADIISAASLTDSREIKIVCTVFLHTVRSPHRIRL